MLRTWRLPCGVSSAILRPGGTYVLEYANKRNLKAVARYLLRRQSWSPFDPTPYEFVRLNFDFHPAWMANELAQAGFAVDAGKAVSHFRYPLIKRSIPARTLAAMDGLLQDVGAVWKFAPSIFLRARVVGTRTTTHDDLFCCPACRGLDLRQIDDALVCEGCGAAWPRIDGIYDFKTPLETPFSPSNPSQML